MKKYILLVLMVLCCTTLMQAEYTRISHFTELNDIFAECDENTLVIFDVDEVILLQDDLILRPCGKEFLQNWIIKNNLHKDKNKLDELTSIVLLESKRSLIESDIVSHIHSLKSRSVPVIGLTATKARGQGVITSIPDWRIQDLKKFGISFEDSFSWASGQDIPLTEETTLPPLFKNGIIFNDKTPKGSALKGFLEMIDWTPRKIIFIDDRPDNLASMKYFMSTHPSCALQLIHYTGAERLHTQINEELALFQLNHLQEHKKWLSDDEATMHLSGITSMQDSVVYEETF